MELFKSLENKTKSYNDPFKHFEINQPLTDSAIKEISDAEVIDPKKENLNYDGTRALDGGEGAYRSGIKDGGKAIQELSEDIFKASNRLSDDFTFEKGIFSKALGAAQEAMGFIGKKAKNNEIKRCFIRYIRLVDIYKDRKTLKIREYSFLIY